MEYVYWECDNCNLFNRTKIDEIYVQECILCKRSRGATCELDYKGDIKYKDKKNNFWCLHEDCLKSKISYSSLDEYKDHLKNHQ